MEKQNLLVLIDGNSLINRAFYALPPLSAADGTPSNAVYGFTTMLIKLISDYKPKYIAVAFDMRAPTFRHKMYDGYKAARKGMPDDLAVQMPLLKDMLRAMNICIVEQEGVEADDIIGTMAKRHGTDTMIVTGDKDSLQLIDDTTTVLLTKRGISETALMNITTLAEEFGLTPPQIIDYKALAGDASDSIPGVGGVGDKTATDLLQRYGTLGGVYENLGELKGKLLERLIADKEKAELSYKLATIKIDCEVEAGLSDCVYDYPFSAAVMDIFNNYGFKSLTRRAELFGEEALKVTEAVVVEDTEVSTAAALADALAGAESFALTLGDKVCVSADGARQYSVSVMQTLLDILPTTDDVLAALKALLENGKIIKYVYDAKRVIKMLAARGITLRGYRDVALAQYLTDMSIRYSNPEAYAVECGYKPSECAACLAAQFPRLERELEKQGMKGLYYDIEHPLIEVLYGMEKAGFMLDLYLLNDLGKKYEKLESESAAKITALAGHSFNLNSPKQLAHVLFEELKIPYPRRSGSISTSAEILNEIEDSKIVSEVLRYRFIAKLRSTYIEGLRKVASRDGVVHTEFNQMLTTTGRLSSSEPNLQNIPVREDEGRVLRGLFVARQGYTLVAADYSQIELRVMAHLSGDKNLIAAFERGEDIHTAVACELFGVKSDAINLQMRRVAKTVNFGIIYGMSAFGLSSRLGIAKWKAKDYIDKYFLQFPDVKAYLDGIVSEAKKSGYTVSILGRRRVIPELKSADYRKRQFGERAAMNMPLQASAADIIKLAMLRVSKKLEGMESKLILQVHDELIIQSPAREVDAVCVMLKAEMEGAMKLKVPLIAEVKTGKNWLECK